MVFCRIAGFTNQCWLDGLNVVIAFHRSSDDGGVQMNYNDAGSPWGSLTNWRLGVFDLSPAERNLPQ